MPQRQQYYAAGPQEGGVIGRSMRGGNNGQEPGGPGGMADPPKQDPPPPPLPPPPEPPPAPETKPDLPPPDGGKVPPPPSGEAEAPAQDPPARPGDPGYDWTYHDYGPYMPWWGDEQFGWRGPGLGSVIDAYTDPLAPIDFGDFRYRDFSGEAYYDRLTGNPGGSLNWAPLPDSTWNPTVSISSYPGDGTTVGFNIGHP